MKRLTRLLLIHWHYFTKETISFEQLNFLTGKNASGKSTIIDAMQLLLLGDTSGSFFNKAANGKGSRSLLGYLMGELGDDEGAGFKYLRTGRFTSYIAMEFYDEEKERFFTGGCCFDVFSESDVSRLFFLYDGALPESGFVTDGTPWDKGQLRESLRASYPAAQTTAVGKEFRTALYGRMGGLRDRFGALLKKAVSFNPNVDIQDFISEFVCDTQQTVDVSLMQENIRSYKRLEEEADVLQEKIGQLDRVGKEYAAFRRAKQDELLYHYLMDRAQQDQNGAALGKAKQRAEELLAQLRDLERIMGEQSGQLAHLQEEYSGLQVRLLNDETARAMQALKDEIAAKEAQLRSSRAGYDRAMARLGQFVSGWAGRVRTMTDKLAAETDGAEMPFRAQMKDLCGEGEGFLAKLKGMETPDDKQVLAAGEQGLQELSGTAQALSMSAGVLSSHIGAAKQKLTARQAELRQEQRSLEGGIYQFPADVLCLKEAIAARLREKAGEAVKVTIAAEAAEIAGDRWRNVIEGYLLTQRFYILVPDRYYTEALRIYDEMKREKRLYGAGLVDMEKLRGKTAPAEPGTLAEEIVTADPDVRTFLDSVLGRVHKCGTVEELRGYGTAITDEGMLYQNYVARAMDPGRWSKPAIGRGAILRRLSAVQAELAEVSAQVCACDRCMAGVEQCRKLAIPGESDLMQALAFAREKQDQPALEQAVLDLNHRLATTDTSAVEALQRELAQVDERRRTLEADIRKKTKAQGSLEEQLRALREGDTPRLQAEKEQWQSRLAQGYPAPWVQETGEVRYQRELAARGGAEEVARAFPSLLGRTAKAQTNLWGNLVALRQDYNYRFHMGFDAESPDNAAYDEARQEMAENRLPDYLTRIEDTRRKAFEQFREDFLSRLENNIRDAYTQIDELNKALRGIYFGEESYRFKIMPRPEYKRYYDMLTDPMKMEGGYNLFSEQFNEKYKAEIDELFTIITGGDAGKGTGDAEKRVQLFTDFRTYLSFDLESVNRQGETQRLSRTMGKKSGGETQTPFYVAVLASFAQLYRSGRDKTQNTARLIIFDEAFSKMDGERIVRSVQLLRQFNFQVILSAPTEKVGDIGTLVDRNLCVLREGKHTCVRAFDPRRSTWLDGE